MNGEERRNGIVVKLQEENKPIKGTKLALYFNVSRQVIVQDIAILRAQGTEIIATPQGYVLLKHNKDKLIKTIAAKHHDYDQMEEELQIMLDHGARIIDVIVEHPLYGEIRTILDINYKKELDDFMQKIRQQKAEPLASLTEGMHYHTLEVPDEDSFEGIKKALVKKGYLIHD